MLPSRNELLIVALFSVSDIDRVINNMENIENKKTINPSNKEYKNYTKYKSPMNNNTMRRSHSIKQPRWRGYSH